MEKLLTKETLLQQADGFRGIARRSRRLADNLTMESDRRRLQRHAQELEESASGLELQAVEAKTGIFGPPNKANQ
jgi:hypothetical protein